jgi:C7-C12 aromatase (ARO/CYC)
VHSVTVAAPAADVFDLVVDVERWPQFFGPLVHVERHVRGADEDTLRLWAVRGPAAVRTWSARRRLDRPGLRVVFDNDPPPPGARTSTGEWSVRERDADSCELTLRHVIEPGDGPPATVEATLRDFGEHSRRQLAEIADTAQRRKDLDELVLSFEDPLFVSGAVEDAWTILYEADRWAQRIPHVSRIAMTEDEPGIQFFDMDTTTPDGKAHTTRSVRVCLPHRLIVYKQLHVPPLLTAHTGHWRFVETPEGVVLSARHTVTLKREALSVLGPDTTVAQARRYARKVLGTNSMKNLQIAKAYAEERADG